MKIQHLTFRLVVNSTINFKYWSLFEAKIELNQFLREVRLGRFHHLVIQHTQLIPQIQGKNYFKRSTILYSVNTF